MISSFNRVLQTIIRVISSEHNARPMIKDYISNDIIFDDFIVVSYDEKHKSITISTTTTDDFIVITVPENRDTYVSQICIKLDSTMADLLHRIMHYI